VKTRPALHKPLVLSVKPLSVLAATYPLISTAVCSLSLSVSNLFHFRNVNSYSPGVCEISCLLWLDRAVAIPAVRSGH